VLGTIGSLCFVYALATMRLSDASALYFTNPIVTALLARVVRHVHCAALWRCLARQTCAFVLQLLKEPWTLLDAIATSVCFAGVVFVAEPAFLFGASADEGGGGSSSSARTLSAGVALFGSVMSALAYVAMRPIGKQANGNTVVTWYGIVGVVMCVSLGLATGRLSLPKNWRDGGACVSCRVVCCCVLSWGVRGVFVACSFVSVDSRSP
jgi:drug/metabolite transporter (DMT)-like permease